MMEWVNHINFLKKPSVPIKKPALILKWKFYGEIKGKQLPTSACLINKQLDMTWVEILTH